MIICITKWSTAMKATATLFLAALLATCLAEAQTNSSNSNAIRVSVVGLHSNDGEVYCALYSSADGFPDGFTKATKTTTAKITNEQAVCEFAAAYPPEYIPDPEVAAAAMQPSPTATPTATPLATPPPR